ncbi:MAG TPA: 23S rRNA (uracil(1939)-C(5))-methyltransferase RlmD [Tetrasphaera sp.]|nr:23S rRNA (uracil(1939)-C(5))-methyltransferase RlmD [Tetrasphaera sp.]
MDCSYFDAGVCRSCTLMGTPYEAQLATKQASAAASLSQHVPDHLWTHPYASRESGFRNKAKLVVGGHPGAVTLGILDGTAHGVDLRECGLYEPGLQAVIPPLAELVDHLRLLPYDVRRARGELKHVLLTHSGTGGTMVRFVLRSTAQLSRIRDVLPRIPEHLPDVRVVSANLQPEHKAIIEGPQEIVLTGANSIPLDVADVRLHLRPNTFFQTNTAVAQGLYEQARDWCAQVQPRVIWDLYCGVGGFALALAAPDREVLGVEIAPEAIASARRSVRELPEGPGMIRFEVGDALDVIGQPGWPAADLVVLNPPRRGVGAELCAELERRAPETIIYSSCHPASLARDLDLLAGYEVGAARLFDMFPQTTHCEVMLLLRRRPASAV